MKKGGRGARIALALLVTAVVGGALYLGVLRNNLPEVPGTRVALDLSKADDGPAPDHFDSGQPAVISRNTGPGTDLVVRDHKLTFDPADDGTAAASYGSPDMNRSITTIGARWVFTPRSDAAGGSINLIVANGAAADSPAIPPIPVQLVLTPINWNLNGKKDDATGPQVLAAGNFEPALAVDGVTAYEASVSIDGSRATINLPDGTHRSINDARISQWRGNYATFGLYSNNGLTDAVGGFEKIWATSRPGDA